MKIKIGELYYLDVAYDDPSKVKKRPVMILDEIGKDVLILVSTISVGRNNPPKYYDRYKVPIYNWRKTGLQKPSWFRVYRLIRLPRKEVKSLIKPSDYIGRMHPEDFNNVLREIERLHG